MPWIAIEPRDPRTQSEGVESPATRTPRSRWPSQPLAGAAARPPASCPARRSSTRRLPPCDGRPGRLRREPRHRPAHPPAGARGRRGRRAGARRGGRDLALQRRRQVHPSQRLRATRRPIRTSTAPRAWSPATAALVELRTIKPARLSGARHRRLVAPAAHPFLGLGQGVAVAPGDADVLPGRSAQRRTTRILNAVRDPEARRALHRASRADRAADRQRAGLRISAGGARPQSRAAHAVTRLVPTAEMTLGPFFPREFAQGANDLTVFEASGEGRGRSRSPGRVTAARRQAARQRGARDLAGGRARAATTIPSSSAGAAPRPTRNGLTVFRTLQPGASAGRAPHVNFLVLYSGLMRQLQTTHVFRGRRPIRSRTRSRHRRTL